MWEKINKVSVQVIASVIIIIGCFVLAILAATNRIPAESQGFVSSIVSPMLLGAMGWLFTATKNQRTP